MKACSNLASIFLAVTICSRLFFFPSKSLAFPKKTVDQQKKVIEALTENKKTICSLSKLLNIPSTAIAGVILAESYNNRDLVDLFQDIYLSNFLKSYDSDWWENWAVISEQSAQESKDLRFLSNKWPISLVESGYVMSFGLAQITPRIALLACQQTKYLISSCNGDVKYIISGLLDKKRSIEITAAILYYEAIEYRKATDYNPTKDLALLSTLYNIGGEFYRINDSKIKNKPNKFGRWVQDNKSFILSIVTCSEGNELNR